MMSWSGSVYECRLYKTLTWSDLKLLSIILYGRQTACCWWSVHRCCDKQEVRCHASLNLSHLRYDCQRWTPAVAQHRHWTWLKCTRTFNFRKYLNAHLKFTVYGRKHSRSIGCIYTYTFAQCSPASLGLTQARSNYFSEVLISVVLLCKGRQTYRAEYSNWSIATLIIDTQPVYL